MNRPSSAGIDVVLRDTINTVTLSLIGHILSPFFIRTNAKALFSDKTIFSSLQTNKRYIGSCSRDTPQTRRGSIMRRMNYSGRRPRRVMATMTFLVALVIGVSGLIPLNTGQRRVVGRVNIPTSSVGGDSSLKTVSQIGCGTWSWGNRLLWNYDTSQDDEIYEAYKIVRNAGVTVFDTADSYGTLDLNGRAEILLGEFERRYQSEKQQPTDTTNQWWNLGNMAGNSQMADDQAQQVATKFAPYPWRITRGSLVKAAKESLERLGQSKLSIAQLHWSTANYQPFQEGALWEGIADIYDAGLCEAVGVSNYGPQQLQKIASRMQERQVPLATAQIQYSLMTYQNCKDMNDACDQVGCKLISYSPLCLVSDLVYIDVPAFAFHLSNSDFICYWTCRVF